MEYEGTIDYEKLSTELENIIKTHPVFCRAIGISVVRYPVDQYPCQKRHRVSPGSIDPSGSAVQPEKRQRKLDRGGGASSSGDLASPALGDSATQPPTQTVTGELGGETGDRIGETDKAIEFCKVCEKSASTSGISFLIQGVTHAVCDHPMCNNILIADLGGDVAIKHEHHVANDIANQDATPMVCCICGGVASTVPPPVLNCPGATKTCCERPLCIKRCRKSFHAFVSKQLRLFDAEQRAQVLVRHELIITHLPQVTVGPLETNVVANKGIDLQYAYSIIEGKTIFAMATATP